MRNSVGLSQKQLPGLFAQFRADPVESFAKVEHPCRLGAIRQSVVVDFREETVSPLDKILCWANLGELGGSCGGRVSSRGVAASPWRFHFPSCEAMNLRIEAKSKSRLPPLRPVPGIRRPLILPFLKR
jgi:hypothetical protein